MSWSKESERHKLSRNGIKTKYTIHTQDNISKELHIEKSTYNNQLYIKLLDSNNNQIGIGVFVEKPNAVSFAPGCTLWVDPKYRKLGLATLIFNTAEKITGKPYVHSSITTPVGKKFINNYCKNAEQ